MAEFAASFVADLSGPHYTSNNTSNMLSPPHGSPFPNTTTAIKAVALIKALHVLMIGQYAILAWVLAEYALQVSSIGVHGFWLIPSLIAAYFLRCLPVAGQLSVAIAGYLLLEDIFLWPWPITAALAMALGFSAEMLTIALARKQKKPTKNP